jgi:autotransporter-associated beta strand protein
LTGNKNLATVFATGGGYSSLTNVTLNPVTGATPSYSGVIANGVPGMTLTKTGAGTQTLTAANTYSGPTVINAGVLEINAANNIGDSSVTNTISFGGGTLRSTANTYSLGANRNITLTGAGTIQVAADTLTIDGTVTNGANLLTLNVTGAAIVAEQRLSTATIFSLAMLLSRAEILFPPPSSS